MLGAVGKVLAWPLILLVTLYRFLISPWLGPNCRFQPSCSAYAVEALTTHGLFRGTALTARRIARCHPWGDSGYDPVPDTLERERTTVLTHAYGFISRGNRDGGFRHVTEWIAKDPDPVAAWAWFFERMTEWEQQQPALFFAKLYVHDLLRHNDDIAALKLIQRCRLIDETFRPAREDLEASVDAATRNGNIELATVLKRV